MDNQSIKDQTAIIAGESTKIEELKFTISKVTTGKLNALVKNVMKQMNINDPNKAVKLINSGQWIIVPSLTRKWYEKDNTYYCSYTSDGRTGPEWWEHFNRKGHPVDDEAKTLLFASDFNPTRGKTTTMAISKSKIFTFDGGKMADMLVMKNHVLYEKMSIVDNIRAIADQCHFLTPNIEAACYLYDMFTPEDFDAMGIRELCIMHEPTGRKGELLCILADHNDMCSKKELRACYGGPKDRIGSHNYGVAFEVPSKEVK